MVFMSMKKHHPAKYPISKGNQYLLKEMGLDPIQLLRLTGLPEDLYAMEKPEVTAEQYFNSWLRLEQATCHIDFPLEFARHFRLEGFDAPIFAALCCPDFNSAVTQLARFKPLLAPLSLTVEQTQETTSVTISSTYADFDMPPLLSMVELVFFTQLIRLATRTEITPVEVQSACAVSEPEKYRALFGVPLQHGLSNKITFSRQDATRAFVTQNNNMWGIFEQGLQKQLSSVDTSISLEQRVKNALLELIPSGLVSIDNLADRLGMSKRTLQRKLSQENIGYQHLLNQTREKLAKHYLVNTRLSSWEITFLLGFQENSSYCRSFASWTGMTPEEFRKSHQSLN